MDVRILLFGLYLFAGLIGCAQTYVFDQLTTSDGLSNDNVRDILQDADGYLWVATRNGLNKYDGYEFQVYQHDPSDSSSIMSGSTEFNSLHLDRDRHLWVGTTTGLSKYCPQADRFINYYFDGGKLNAQGYNAITDVADGKNDQLYVATIQGLLLRFDKKTGKYTPFGSNIDNSINKIEAIGDTLWMATDMGFYGLDLRTGVRKSYVYSSVSDNRPNMDVINFSIEHGLIYLMTRTYGVLVFSIRKDQFIKSITAGVSLPRDMLSSGTNTWIGMGDGLLVLPVDGEPMKIFPDPDNPLGLHADPKVLYEDDQGNIWVGGDMKGLSVIRNDFGIARHSARSTGQLTLSEDRVTSIYEDQTAGLWVGYYSGQIDFFDRTSGFEQPETYLPESKGTIFDFLEDEAGDFWICTNQKGLLKLGDSRAFSGQSKGDKGSVFQPADVRSISVSGESLWVATMGNGIFQYMKTDQAPVLARIIDTKSSLPNDFVYRVHADSTGAAWAITASGFSEITPDGVVHSYYHNPNDENSLSHSACRSMYVDRNQNVWVGTLAGLDLFDRKNRRFHRLGKWVGLQGKEVTGILEDHEGNIWVSAQMTLVVIHNGAKLLDGVNIDQLEYQKFDLRGLTGYMEFYPGAMHVRANGSVLLGGNKGIISFHPNELIQLERPEVPVLITGFSVFHEPWPFQRAFPDEIGHPVELNHDQSMVSFKYGAIDLASADHITYTYQLEGLKDQWVDAGLQREVTFASLGPGSYQFHVRAFREFDGHMLGESSLSFMISPPLWHTIWFRVLVTMCLIMLALGFYYYRVRHYKRQQELLRLKVAERTTELNEANTKLLAADQVKTQFFMNISHEFRTPLTLILGPVQSLLSEELSPEVHDSLNMIHRNSKRLLRLVNQLLDLRKLETESMSLRVQYGDIVDFAHAIFESFQYLANRYHITFTFLSDQPTHYGWFDRDILDKVLYNLMSNAFKYTSDQGEISLELQKVLMQNGHERMRISVSDNGQGIGKKHLPHIFDRFYQGNSAQVRKQSGTGIGLSLTKELVLLHKGAITVESPERGGTVFSMDIPIDVKAYAQNERTEMGDADEVEQYPHITDEMLPEPLAVNFANRNMDMDVILIVDDNEDLRAFIRQGLGGSFSVEEAEDGDQGLCEALRVMPDVIISDVKMPKQDGITFCRKVKTNEKLNHIPFILLTSRSEEEDELLGLESGADDYLPKPFNISILAARVKSILRNRELVQLKFKQQFSLASSAVEVESLEQQLLKKIMEVFQEHLSDSTFNIQKLCELTAMSQPQLYRKIKATTGLSPTDLLKQYRLKQAALLLSCKAENVSQIAYQVGFSDPDYFRKCFKDQYGLAPSKYMEQAIKCG